MCRQQHAHLGSVPFADGLAQQSDTASTDEIGEYLSLIKFCLVEHYRNMSRPVTSQETDFKFQEQS
jgi:hypothetical protein